MSAAGGASRANRRYDETVVWALDIRDVGPGTSALLGFLPASSAATHPTR